MNRVAWRIVFENLKMGKDIRGIHIEASVLCFHQPDYHTLTTPNYPIESSETPTDDRKPYAANHELR